MNLCASSIYKLFLGVIVILFGADLFSQITDTAQKKFVVDSISVIGNKKTKSFIILREVNFCQGDSLCELDLQAKTLRSQQNLMNTSLFVFDTVYYSIDTITQKAKVLISVKERLYFWPSLILEIQDRNFNAWWYQEHRSLERLNYGVAFTLYNIFGANQTLTFIFRKGYTEQYGAGYRIPFINKKRTIGLNASYYYYRNNQIWYNTHDNELQFYTDRKQYVRQENEAKIGLTYRHKLYQRNSFEMFYRNCSVLDTIVKQNDNYFSSGQNFIQYFSLQYRFYYDVRDYKPYPLKGYLLEAFVTKDGIGVLKNETPDNLYLFGGIRHHFKLFSRAYMMNSVKGRLAAKYTPMYYFNRAHGFSELVRGYEYYVIDGQNYCTLKSNIRFQIIKPRSFKVPGTFLEKFTTVGYSLYAGPFVDAGYVSDDYFATYNKLSNQWLVVGGFGIDVVTYYDFVFRTEFTINKMGEPGIYLHFNAPL